jgi:hypothetical protein
MYDEGGNVTTIADPLEQASYFAYDALGRTLWAKECTNPLSVAFRVSEGGWDKPPSEGRGALVLRWDRVACALSKDRGRWRRRR